MSRKTYQKSAIFRLNIVQKLIVYDSFQFNDDKMFLLLKRDCQGHISQMYIIPKCNILYLIQKATETHKEKCML